MFIILLLCSILLGNLVPEASVGSTLTGIYLNAVADQVHVCITPVSPDVSGLFQQDGAAAILQKSVDEHHKEFPEMLMWTSNFCFVSTRNLNNIMQEVLILWLIRVVCTL